MITTKSKLDLIEVMQNDVIRVRVKTSIFSDDVQIAESFEHRVISPRCGLQRRRRTCTSHLFGNTYC
jgi:DNA repair photolyase